MRFAKTAALIFGPFIIVTILAVSARAGFNDGKLAVLNNGEGRRRMEWT